MRISKKNITYVFISFVLAVSTPNIALGLTWQDCVQSTVSNNIDLMQARQGIEQENIRLGISQADLLPSIQSSMRGSYSENSSGSGSDSYSAGVSLQQLLFDGGKTINQIKKALLTIDIANLDYLNLENTILLETRLEYINALKQQALITIAKDLVNRRQKQYDLIKIRYEAGREHKGALLEAKANAYDAIDQEKKKTRDYITSLKKLARLTGLKFSENEAVNDKLNASKHVTLDDFQIESHLNHTLSLLTIEKVEKDLQISKGDLWPQVNANANYSLSDTNFFPQDSSWSLSMSLSYPLWDWNARGSQIKIKENDLIITQMDYQNTIDDIIETLENALVDYQNAIDDEKTADAYLKAVIERSKIAELQYTNGIINFETWLQVENELAQREKTYIESQAAILRAEASLIAAKGGNLKHEL
ncbi:TolC family protein [Thermoproteota archaeon]